jgi:hypothetical protein
MSGPPLPTPATPTTIPPPVEKATRPLAPKHKATVPPPPSKKPRPAAPAPLPRSAAPKRGPAKAVAAPRRGKSAIQPAPTPAVLKKRNKHRKGRKRHTNHGLLRCGVQLTPPAGSNIHAINITPDMLRDINKHLKDDIASDIGLEYSMDVKVGIFISATRVPSETTCVLKHVRRLVTILGILPIQSAAITSTTYLKVIDVPHIPAKPRVWLTTQRAAFTVALRSSPIGSDLSRYLKHTPRFMRTTPHADTCVAWLDISDSVAGSNARAFIGKRLVIGGRNCQIWGTAPRPGSAQCTGCMKWGHHSGIFFFFFFFSMAACISWTFTWRRSTTKHLVSLVKEVHYAPEG